MLWWKDWQLSICETEDRVKLLCHVLYCFRPVVSVLKNGPLILISKSWLFRAIVVMRRFGWGGKKLPTVSDFDSFPCFQKPYNFSTRVQRIGHTLVAVSKGCNNQNVRIISWNETLKLWKTNLFLTYFLGSLFRLAVMEFSSLGGQTVDDDSGKSAWLIPYLSADFG